MLKCDTCRTYPRETQGLYDTEVCAICLEQEVRQEVNSLASILKNKTSLGACDVASLFYRIANTGDPSCQ